MIVFKTNSFARDYEVAAVDAPPGGLAEYEFTAGRGSARAVVFSVIPWSDGEPWIGRFAVDDPLVRSSVSGLFGTPSPTTLCVVERGAALLVDVSRPFEGRVVSAPGPIVEAIEAAEASVLLLATPWSITAVTADGEGWTSDRIAIEGFRIDEIEGDWLRGVADPSDEELRDFALNLRTGSLVGGAGVG